jgi:hypothetical protein
MLDSSIGSTARKKHRMPIFLKKFRLFAQILECCLMNLFTCVVCVVIFRGGNINVIFFLLRQYFFFSFLHHLAIKILVKITVLNLSLAKTIKRGEKTEHMCEYY